MPNISITELVDETRGHFGGTVELTNFCYEIIIENTGKLPKTPNNKLSSVFTSKSFLKFFTELKQTLEPGSIAVALIGILFMLIGIPANMLILFVTTFDTKTKKTPSAIFMNNFAVADLVMLLFRTISVDFRLKQFPFQWNYGKLLCYMESTLELVVSGNTRLFECRVSANISKLNLVVSVSMITLMALDRYGAIKSYTYMQASTRTSTFYIVRLVAVLVWVFAFLLANPLWPSLHGYFLLLSDTAG